MSDTETIKLAPQKGASGAAWTDNEKIAYLLVLLEAGGQVDTAAIPLGRSVISCKRMVARLKEKHRDDVANIKAGNPMDAAAATANGTNDSGPEKAPKTPRKRKAKADGEEPAKKRGRKKAGVEAEQETKIKGEDQVEVMEEV